MYKYSKFRQISATVAGLFGKTRAARRFNRDWVRYHGLISTVGKNRIPRQKYPEKIPFALCFNARGCKMAAVTLKSLLMASAGRCDYDVYCVITEDVDKDCQDVFAVFYAEQNQLYIFYWGIMILMNRHAADGRLLCGID